MGHWLTLISLFALLTAVFTNTPAAAPRDDFETLGYRSCGTGRGTCHESDGTWWKGDPHFNTVNNLKRKRNRSLRIAQAYGLKPGEYLRGSSKCAECHGEVVTSRAAKNMNTGVSCESCHGAAGPKSRGYYEAHQEGQPPADPLSTQRTGYQKALRLGMTNLRNLNNRAATCVRCHQITDKKLLEADHPTGEGFDYVKGIRNNISKHWDYELRPQDLDDGSFVKAVAARPIPQFTVKEVSGALPPDASFLSAPETTFIHVDPNLPAWLNPKRTISVKSFNPKLSANAPLDSIFLEIKNYIDYIHREIKAGD